MVARDLIHLGTVLNVVPQQISLPDLREKPRSLVNSDVERV